VGTPPSALAEAKVRYRCHDLERDRCNSRSLLARSLFSHNQPNGENKMTERCYLLTYKIDDGTGEPILAKEVHRNLSGAVQRCRELEDEKCISDIELEVVYVH